jgi:hypothetical protein
MWWAEDAVAPHADKAMETHHTAGAPDTPPVLCRFFIVRTNQDQSASGIFPRPPGHRPGGRASPSNTSGMSAFAVAGYVRGGKTACASECTTRIRRSHPGEEPAVAKPRLTSLHVTRQIYIRTHAAETALLTEKPDRIPEQQTLDYSVVNYR